DRERPRRQRGTRRIAQGHRRGSGQEGRQVPDLRRYRDAQELEPPLQAQPRQDEDRRHLRARRGGAEPGAPRRREGPLDRRKADVRQGEEDPRLGAHVREEHERGRGARVARGDLDGGREAEAGEAGCREEAGGCGEEAGGDAQDDLGRGEEARREEARRRAVTGVQGVWAVLVAAGRGERLGEDRPKAFVRLGELPLLAEPLRRLDDSAWVDAVVVVAPPEWEEPAILLAEEIGASKVTACVTGAETRTGSVRAGVGEVPEDAAVILVHDAARPVLPEDVVERVVRALGDGFDGAVPALPVADTIKRVDGDVVSETLARDELVAVQTPQAFVAPVLRAALDGGEGSDCASLVERQGGRIRVVRGDERLLKVTTRADLERVAAWL